MIRELEVADLETGPDKIAMTVPMFIRALEWAKESAKDDLELHKFVENILAADKVLGIDDYNSLFNGITEPEKNGMKKQFTVLFSASYDSYDKDLVPTAYTEYVWSEDNERSITQAALWSAARRVSKEKNIDQTKVMQSFQRTVKVLAITEGFKSMAIAGKIQRRDRPIISRVIARLKSVASTYKYAMFNRPVGIGCNPKEGFVGTEDRPAKGHDHYDYARNGVAIYNRKLTDHETKQFEMAPMLEGRDLDSFAESVAFEMSDYSTEYLEMSETDHQDFLKTILQNIKQAAKGYPPSVGNLEKFAKLVENHLRKDTR